MPHPPIFNVPAPTAGQQKWEYLRARHPRFVYESFTLEPGGDSLRVRFHFRIEPNIQFTPEVTFEPVDWRKVEAIPKATLENLAYHLGLIEMLSYWKAACSPEILVRAGALGSEQIDWWRDLLQRGMGEFFYVNRIDFLPADFVRIVANEEIRAAPALSEVEGTVRERAAEEKPIPLSRRAGRDRDDSRGEGRESVNRDLVLTSGGKDSVVTLELLREAGRGFDCLLLNPTEAARAVARQAGCNSPVIVRRAIDPRLLELNAAGYLNGHTPFSALLAILGITVAVLGGYPRVMVANERSAEEAPVEYLGAEINHQYSKTFRFERIFRQYSENYLAPGVEYFSLLRPLYELQIARRFSGYPQYFPLFKSCNRGLTSNSWCGRCPKCLFVFAALYPFLDRDQILGIFGEDLFAGEGTAEGLRALLGLDQEKPFECVGTKEETLTAIYLCARKYREQGIELPAALTAIQGSVLSSRHDLPDLAQRILTAWTDQHHLPPQLAARLRR